MTIETKLTGIGIAAILLLDTITSLLSLHVHFSYALYCTATLAVYFGLTYRAARHLKLRGTLAFGALLGLIDATAGCKLCFLLGADPDHRLQQITRGAWCRMVILVTMSGAFIALVAYLIASSRNKRESP